MDIKIIGFILMMPMVLLAIDMLCRITKYISFKLFETTWRNFFLIMSILLAIYSLGNFLFNL
jgi:hypothetical protein